jgi:hypothetical protein
MFPEGRIMATTPTFFESFDNGLGSFSRAWGPGVDTSVPGQLTIHSAANNWDSGAMMPPTGPRRASATASTPRRCK